MRHLTSILEGIFDSDTDVNYNNEILSEIGGSSQQNITCSVEGSTLYIDSNESVYNMVITKSPDKYGIKKIVLRGGIDKLTIKHPDINFKNIDIETPGPVIISSAYHMGLTLRNINIKCLYLIFQREGNDDKWGKIQCDLSLNNVNVELTKPNGIVISRYKYIDFTKCSFKRAEFVHFDHVHVANKYFINDIFDATDVVNKKAVDPTKLLKEYAKNTKDIDVFFGAPIDKDMFERNNWPDLRRIIVHPYKSGNAAVYTNKCNPKSQVAKFTVKFRTGWTGYISTRYLDEVDMQDE